MDPAREDIEAGQLLVRLRTGQSTGTSRYSFKHALEAAPCRVSDHVFYNNYGAALYSVGSYEGAAKRFHEALDHCGDRDDRFTINVSYAFALQKVDLARCRKTTKEMLSRLDEYSAQMLLAKVFILLYLCRDFQSAYAIRAPLLEEYHLDSPLIAMVFDCSEELGKAEDARERLRLQVEDLAGYEYDTRKEIRNARLALESREFRKKLIADYRHMPPRIAQCYYLGCPKHNPL